MTKIEPIENLTKDEKKLVEYAKKAREKAYAPYSNFLVGCSLLDSFGNIYTGCNVENASYSATVCAERVAIFSMVASGGISCNKLIVITSSQIPCFPCGMCLQVLAEFGKDSLIIAVNKDASYFQKALLSELFPAIFDKNKLFNSSS